MSERPTLAELRSRVFKHSPIHDPRGVQGPEVGNWLARRLGRPLALYGTWAAVRLGLSAHLVTLAALVAGAASALAFGTGTRAGFVAGVALGHVAFWLDHVDGQVARWRGTSSLGGVYFDYLMHHAHALMLGFGLGYGLALRSGDLRWTTAGFAIALGWAFLGLHNDCRYKSFFERLKREGRTFRVDGGSGERPAPPATWPGRGRGAITWPAYKACEPHVVLVALTALAPLALTAPSLWAALWRLGVLAMAVLAPLLAIGRSAKAVILDAPEAEFRRWFRPWGEA